MSAIVASAFAIGALAPLGAIAGVIACKRAARRASAHTLAAMARYDTLTGLLNRNGFADVFDRWMARPRSSRLALAIFEIEQLERSIALFGYQEADDLLIQIAGFLSDMTRSDGLVARLDGARFAAALEITSNEHLVRRLQRTRCDLDALIETSTFFGMARISVGAAVTPDDGDNFETLTPRALAALEQAREDGAERLAFFEPGMHERLMDRAALEQDLACAVRDNAIEPFLQPIVALNGGQIQSYEILARWFDARRGQVPPDTFIPLAEELGLIETLTFNLLRRACQETKTCPSSVRLSLNVPPRLLDQPGTAFRLLSALSACGFAPSRLEIEITETAPIAHPSQAEENLRLLRARGVRVALDDFGAGLSNFTRLHQLPVDIVKIDRSLVAAMLDDERAREMVASIVALARSLGIVANAEGVESSAHASMLRTLGCDLGQGYLFAPPQSARSIAPVEPGSTPANDNRAQAGAA